MPVPAAELPSQDALLACFDYDPMTGVLRWRRRDPIKQGMKIANGKCAGKAAGYVREGKYIAVMLDDVTYYAHRIIWKMVTGNDPPDWIDHEDGDGTNNRWLNMRAATHAQNMWNTSIFRNNTSGYRGVSFIKSHGKFRAAIGIGGKKKHIGYFNTAAEAHLAVAEAIFKTRGDFARVA
jgi:hypothetical protein